MDLADQAQQSEELARQAALQAQARRTPSGQTSSSHCQHCTRPIPILRQRAIAGARLCVNCQARQEGVLA